MLRRVKTRDNSVMGVSVSYCSAMSNNNYNIFPEAPYIIVGRDGNIYVTGERQDMRKMCENEKDTPNEIF